ncbi:MAG: radical SAM protein, partial [Deltaproteobacteria bacterium]|nr:radical SAM protein [Deltaproteobacteria bacterium]
MKSNEIIMNAFEKQIAGVDDDGLLSLDIDTLQVNMGLRCNQQCIHCHLEASPRRREMMVWPTMQLILKAARSMGCQLVDLTGGAPELNPCFRRFVTALRQADHAVQV